MILTPEASQFLNLIGDYSVGGPHVTPGVEAYSNLREYRKALRFPEDWLYNEAVHINAAECSLSTAYQSLGKKSTPSPVDRVVVMDFDNYTKEGLPKVVSPVSFESLLTTLQDMELPLPFCKVNSGTPGNFHVMWVLREPLPRGKYPQLGQTLYSYWGADAGFTNSTLRNPVYAEKWLDATTWWNQWTDTPPLLDSPLDLLPSHMVPEDMEKEQVSEIIKQISVTHPSKHGLYTPRMTEEQLEAAMARARDGDGRWYLLRAWMNRKIFAHFLRSDSPLRSELVSSLVRQGNHKFKEPMSSSRIRRMELYWTPQNQVRYVARQRSAGRTSERSWANHRSAVIRYFEALDMKTLLTDFTSGGGELPEELVSRDLLFNGDRVASRSRRLSLSYLAWMLGVEDEDVLDPSTGEVLKTVTAPNKVKYLLANGKRNGYTREQYDRYMSAQDEDETSEEPTPELTPPPRYVKLNKYVLEVPMGFIPPKLVKRKRLVYD